jgi:predicted nucleic acid-binding protein
VTLVVNSGPLISLARIGHLGLLPGLFDEIVSPRAVFDEVTLDPALPGAEAIANAGWLRTVDVSDRKAVARLLAWLDRGESEVLVLAQEIRGTAAIDERRGRKLATTLGVPQTGTVGILVLAKRRRMIPAITPLLDQLRARGIYLSPRLYDDARRSTGEL